MIRIDKLASIVQRKDIYIFTCTSQTTKMTWIFQEPILTCPSNCTDEYLGLKVYEILNYSIKGVPHPEKLIDDTKPTLKATNVKSMKQFYEASICAQIMVTGDNVRLDPSVNEGSRRGFMGKTYLPIIEISKDDFFAYPELAGKKVRECLLLCK